MSNKHTDSAVTPQPQNDDTNQPDRVTVELFENQRWYPIKGWSGKLLPTERPHYSTEDGTAEKRKEHVFLPPQYQWEGEWGVCVMKDRTDAETGWEYAVDFSGTWQGHCSTMTCVRRRMWERAMVRKSGVNGEVVELQSSDCDMCDVETSPFIDGHPNLTTATASPLEVQVRKQKLVEHKNNQMQRRQVPQQHVVSNYVAPSITKEVSFHLPESFVYGEEWGNSPDRKPDPQPGGEDKWNSMYAQFIANALEETEKKK